MGSWWRRRTHFHVRRWRWCRVYDGRRCRGVYNRRRWRMHNRGWRMECGWRWCVSHGCRRCCVDHWCLVDNGCRSMNHGSRVYHGWRGGIRRRVDHRWCRRPNQRLRMRNGPRRCRSVRHRAWRDNSLAMFDGWRTNMPWRNRLPERRCLRHHRVDTRSGRVRCRRSVMQRRDACVHRRAAGDRRCRADRRTGSDRMRAGRCRRQVELSRHPGCHPDGCGRWPQRFCPNQRPRLRKLRRINPLRETRYRV